jgi:hypothetical protein
VRLGEHRDAVHERVERRRAEARLVAARHQRLVDFGRQLGNQAGGQARQEAGRGTIADFDQILKVIGRTELQRARDRPALRNMRYHRY